MTKCSVDNKILNPCSSLNNAMDHEGKNGMTLCVLRNLGTMEVSRTMAVLRSGKLPKNGVVINYCPFCGESISHHVIPLNDDN